MKIFKEHIQAWAREEVEAESVPSSEGSIIC
jgi:hypothetical protein